MLFYCCLLLLVSFVRTKAHGRKDSLGTFPKNIICLRKREKQFSKYMNQQNFLDVFIFVQEKFNSNLRNYFFPYLHSTNVKKIWLRSLLPRYLLSTKLVHLLLYYFKTVEISVSSILAPSTPLRSLFRTSFEVTIGDSKQSRIPIHNLFWKGSKSIRAVTDLDLSYC